MINLILDTNIYDRDPKRETNAFQAISRLCKENKITLHIPYIVKKEYISHIEEDYEKYINNISREINNISRVSTGDLLNNQINSFKKSFDKLKETKKLAVDEFINWLNSLKVKQYELNSNDSIAVFDSYFSGKPPFSTRKSRKDIPDSFIFEEINSICKKLDTTHFVSTDDNFRNSFKDKSKVRVYPSLDEFINSDTCQNVLKEKDIENKITEIKNYLYENVNLLNEKISALSVDALCQKEIVDNSIPDDNNEASITSTISDPTNIRYNFSEISYYGEGVINIPFDFEVEVYADYYIYKPDYYSLDEDEQQAMSVEDWNKHYFLVDKDFNINVSGAISIKIDVSKEIKNTPVSQLLDFTSCKIDEIFEIKLL